LEDGRNVPAGGFRGTFQGCDCAAASTYCLRSS
jgi:hypothetical protein